MSHTVGIRQTQKLKTRQALLGAALQLLEHQSLSSLGLREVTRAVGVTPTAFYRHFDDTAALGVALVEEALGSLHGVIGAILAETGDSEARLDRSVELITRHVRAQPAHFRFIAREQHGGVGQVREAIAAQLRRFAEEVAEALAAEPESRGWSDEDLLMLGGLYVDHMVITASAMLTPPGLRGPGGRGHPSAAAARHPRQTPLAGRHRRLAAGVPQISYRRTPRPLRPPAVRRRNGRLRAEPGAASRPSAEASTCSTRSTGTGPRVRSSRIEISRSDVTSPEVPDHLAHSRQVVREPGAAWFSCAGRGPTGGTGRPTGRRCPRRPRPPPGSRLRGCGW